VVLLLTIGTGVYLANRRTSAHPATGGGPTPTGGIASLPTASSAAPEPTTAAPTTVGAAPPAPAGLPAGWHPYTDPTGFTVAVPDGWSMFKRDGIVYFKEPTGRRLLGIDQTDKPKMNPVADWQAQESYRVARGDFPGYEPLGIRHVDYHVTAADWEFRYDDHGVRTHVVNRGAVFNDHQAYGFYWSTPEDQWTANVPNFQLITQTFQGKP
jgi:hypothetical protein